MNKIEDTLVTELPGAVGGQRVLLLMSPASYRGAPFTEAARQLGLDVVQGIDLPDQLAEQWRVALPLNFQQVGIAVDRVGAYAEARPFDAILAVDDSAALVAAEAAARLGLPHNDPKAALAARDKLRMRELLAAGGVASPAFRSFAAMSDPTEVANLVEYPCVVKPTRLNGSRGVIRADNAAELVAAFTRTAELLRREGEPIESARIIVENFIPGFEVALEGILSDGELTVLALFDKPDPLDGPFFEETIYVTPSRLPAATQRAIAACTRAAARALGLVMGPVHAELRVNERGPWIVEIAGRSIGGLCSTILNFGAGMSLEELILRQAVGLPIASTERQGAAAGVMMIPIPCRGYFKSYHGIEAALATPGVTGVQITAKLNHEIVPLPEGAAYLGFIFARGDDPAMVEAALRQAHAALVFDIRPIISLADRRTNGASHG